MEEFKKLYPNARIMKLTDVDRELIVRYILQDDRLVFFGRPITAPEEKKK